MEQIYRFLLVLLLVCTSDRSYADEWLDPVDDKDYIPKEIHVGNLVIIEGCKGEWCFRFCDKAMMVSIHYLPDGSAGEYWFKVFGKGWEESPSKKPIGLKTTKPFTLYSDLQGPNPSARYSAGFIVKPIEQKIVIRNRGNYLIQEIITENHPLQAGDTIDTPIDVGEGYIMVRSNNRWIVLPDFSDRDSCLRTGVCDDLKLKVVRDAKVETWVKVEVDGVIGYTPEDGFLSQCGG